MTRKIVLACVLLCLCGGCGPFGEELAMSGAMNAGRYRDTITTLEAKMNRGEKLSGYLALYYCYASEGIQDYERLSRGASMLDELVRQGFKGYMGEGVEGYPELLQATACMGLAQYDKAIAELDVSDRKRDKGVIFERAFHIRSLSTRGLALALAGRSDEALRVAQTLQDVSVAYPHEILSTDKQAGLARIYVATKDYDKGFAAITASGAKYVGIASGAYDSTFQDLPRIYLRGKCGLETGRLAQAKDDFDYLLKHPSVPQIGTIYWLILYDRARIARREQQFDQAAEMLAKAIVVLEEQRATVHSEAGKIGFVGDKQVVYQEIVSLLVERGRDAEAFEYVERAKARALVDLLAGQKLLAARREHSQQIAEQVSHLAQAEKELALVPNAGDEVSTPRTRGTVLGLKKQIVAQAPELASLITVQGASVRKLQALLGPDETVLEYYRCGPSWYAFVLTRDSLKARKLQATDLEAAVADFRKRLSARDSTAYLPSAQRLYADLVAPVHDLIQGTKLVVVPHGPLHYLPFAALHDGKGYLLDRFNLRVLPSATVLEFLKSAKVDETKGVLAVGNPDLGDPRLDLKFAEAEAKAVVAKVGAGRALVGKEATETAVKTLMGQYRMLHFATHGVFNPAAPLESRLLLAPDGQNNGQLTIGKLYSLQLDADLVTLSGCDTAMGQVANGDDVVGFSRGLLYAGARSIVSSLWEVDDEATSDLMVAFYENLRSQPQQEALRAAQRKLKEQKPHPYFWAAFQLTGASGAKGS